MNIKQTAEIFSILQNQIFVANQDLEKFNDFIAVIDERLN